MKKPLSDTVVTAVESILSSDEPDEQELIDLLASHYRIPKDEAVEILYEVVLALNSTYFPPLQNVEIMVTNKCNLACKYCFEGDHSRHGADMSEEIGIRALRLIFDYSQGQQNIHVTFFGGEPTLCFSLIRRLTEHARDLADQKGKRVTFSMTTNGVCIDQRMAVCFQRHNIKILLSVDGLKSTHDTYRIDRRGRGSFDRVVSTIELLKRTQGFLGARVTVMPSTAQDLYENVLGLHEYGINYFIIGHAIGETWSQDAITRYAAELERIQEWYRRHRSPQLVFSNTGDPKKGGWFGCSAGRSSVAISASGDVAPCSLLHGLGSSYRFRRLGHVDYGLTHLRKRVEILNPTQLELACVEMGIAATYGGGCFGANYVETGEVYGPSLQNHILNSIERRAFWISNGASTAA